MTRSADVVRSSGPLTHAMTVDVEDYFQVAALEGQYPRSRWDTVDLRVERGVDRCLERMADKGVTGTFFTLAWVAERCPEMIRRIVDAGHELASHGYDHTRLHMMEEAAIIEDLRKSKAILEEVGGVRVTGYRAPTFSINRSNQGVYRHVRDAGYLYSSSIYPIPHDLYGIPDAPRWPYEPIEGLTEVPVTTLRFRGRNYPCAGGGWFRLLPYPAYRQLLKHFERSERRPAMFYTHPWEFDPEQPRPDGVPLKSRVRHYLNLDRTEPRLARLLADFSWGRMDEVFGVGACAAVKAA